MSSRIRIHIYFGSLCKSEILDCSKSFDANLKEIIANLGIAPENEQKYTMKLTNGGIVDKNEVLFHDDRVMILPKDEVIPIMQSQNGIKSEIFIPGSGSAIKREGDN